MFTIFLVLCCYALIGGIITGYLKATYEENWDFDTTISCLIIIFWPLIFLVGLSVLLLKSIPYLSIPFYKIIKKRTKENRDNNDNRRN